MTASIWGHAQVAQPAWLEMMPQLPLVRGLPVIMATGRFQGSRAVVCRHSDDGHEVLVLWDDSQPVQKELVSSLRVDLSDPQGQRYAACAYMQRLDRNDAIQMRRGCRWLRACLLGQGAEGDQYKLALALDGGTP